MKQSSILALSTDDTNLDDTINPDSADDISSSYFMMNYTSDVFPMPPIDTIDNGDNGREIRDVDFREWRKQRRRTRSITVRVTEYLRLAIEQYVIDHNISISDFCNSAFTSFLQAEQRVMHELTTRGLSDTTAEMNPSEE